MGHRDIRLIALDLDGTLLNSNKELTPRSRAALEAAAARGAEIVPATGRFYRAMPEAVRALPFVRWAITINGAAVRDVAAGRDIYRRTIPAAEAAEIMAFLDPLPVIYDAYIDGWGYMTAAMQEKAADYCPNPFSLEMIRTLRSPVPELKRYVLERGEGVQKVQFFTMDLALRGRMLRELDGRFEGIRTTSSVANNVEINHAQANKGDALAALATHLGIGLDRVMAFGDGLNDVQMLRAAGLGVAMGGAPEEVRACADLVADTCDSDGAARVIEEYVL
ncbi:MAG: HAD family phosphatase [Oscillospiraceae bacterium]|nr:HAD family phosphatase [Oscillospiraceae bacterium]